MSACLSQYGAGLADGFSYRTYEKNGFRALDTMRFNLTKYGGNGVAEEKFFAWTPGEDASAHDH